MSIKLIVGLRNPGAAYAKTRHNAGGWFVEAMARHYNVSFNIEKKMHGELAQLTIHNNSAWVLLPLTFMNHSGLSVGAVCQFYRLNPDEVLIAHDDLDLPVGRAKLKTGGGHGGHNGLRDITNQLGGTGFHRLRIGIGHPGHKDLVLNYVLGKPSQHDLERIRDAMNHSIDVMPTVLSGNMAIAMSQLNG